MICVSFVVVFSTCKHYLPLGIRTFSLYQYHFAIQLQKIFRIFALGKIIESMKIYRIFGILAASAVMLTACGHSHEGHSHEGHSHESHEHEGHSHENVNENEHEHEHEEGVIHFSHEQAEMANLEIETLVAGDFAEVIRVSGQVLAAQGDESAIVARTPGVVNFTRDHLSEGSEVRNGEVIASVSAAGIAGGDAIAQNRLTLANAKATFERAQRLIADSIISQKEFEKAKLEYESALLAVGGNDGKGGSSAASPLKGYIKQVLVKQGEYVEAGQAIATVTKSCNLQLKAEVPEKHFAALHKVRSANFKMGYDKVARNLDELNGHLVAIGKTADEGSAYIPVTFEFANKGNIVPGSFADIWLIMSKRENVITIPIAALTEAQGIYYAYIQHEDEEDDFERKELRIGASDGIRVEVLSGLQEGDKVVVNGVSQVKMAGASGAIPDAHNHSH